MAKFKDKIVGDLLDKEFLVTWNKKTIYIVAPGKLGKDFYKDIPEDAYVIVVNKAIELIDTGVVKASKVLWLVGELVSFKTDWFKQYGEKYKDILCTGRVLLEHMSFKPFKVFEYHLKIDFVKGALSVGTTVGGMAIQLGVHLGGENIVLCGMDLFGNIYFDGSDGGRKDRENSSWKMQIARIGRLLDVIPNIKLFSLSPTKLKVDKYKKESKGG